MANNHENILYFETEFDYPLIVKGKGIYLYDEDGKKYIDGCAGSISTSLGYGRKDMAEVLSKQAEEISFVHRHHVSSKICNEATDTLKECFPTMDKFFMVSGGTEATECATKLARLHWYHKGKPSKNKVIGRWMSYHGYTTDALAYGGNPGRRKEFSAILREDGHIIPPYCYRCWASKEPESCSFECAKALEDQILAQGPDTVAAFICETVVGTTMGCVTPPDGYYQKIREICDKYDVLMVLDEVMCGSGRCGTMMAIEQYGVVPDIVALAKSMGGGYFPIGCVACTKEAAKPIEDAGGFPVGHTWAGNPIASAVVKKTLEVIKEEQLLDNCTKQGDHLRKRLDELKDKYPFIGDVRGKGLMQAIELVKDKATKESYPRSEKIAEKVFKECMANGLIIMTSVNMDKGQKGDAIMMGTSFDVTTEEIDELVDILEKSLVKVFS
ncbi:MAG: aminotransferase class III-fold pyridoxal phosphate-dependent enzyme [Lachnospiraceae bacterium]|nr:aminotransferase class III-fold pyridoxal phosphate-dependent enzyme [Candidatus Colinaster scatohippi]